MLLLFLNAIIASKSLDPEQNRCFVSPDLGLNCLQRLLAEDKNHRLQGKS